jgi:hypothetical protein
MPTNDYINQLRANRAREAAAAETLLLERRAAGYETLDAATQAAYDSHYNNLVALNARIADAEADELRAGAGNPTLARIRAAQQTQTRRPTMSTHVLNEPEPVYRRGGPNSFGIDLMKASTAGLDLGGEARRRLQEHADFMNERGGLEQRTSAASTAPAVTRYPRHGSWTNTSPTPAPAAPSPTSANGSHYREAPIRSTFRRC